MDFNGLTSARSWPMQWIELTRFTAHISSRKIWNHHVHLPTALERHSIGSKGFQNKGLNYVWPVPWQAGHIFLGTGMDSETNTGSSNLWQHCVRTSSSALALFPPHLCFWACCVHRFQPAGLVERIQAIAQNVSNMAIRVEQILQHSAVQGRGTAAKRRLHKYRDRCIKSDFFFFF